MVTKPVIHRSLSISRTWLAGWCTTTTGRSMRVIITVLKRRWSSGGRRPIWSIWRFVPCSRAKRLLPGSISACCARHVISVSGRMSTRPWTDVRTCRQNRQARVLSVICSTTTTVWGRTTAVMLRPSWWIYWPILTLTILFSRSRLYWPRYGRRIPECSGRVSSSTSICIPMTRCHVSSRRRPICSVRWKTVLPKQCRLIRR